MLVPLRVDQLEHGTERLSKARAVIAGDRQAAALFRAVQREGSDDGVPPDFQAAPEAGDVSGAIVRFGEKVERRPVVPDIVALYRLKGRGVCDEPVNALGAAPRRALAAANAAPDRSSTVTSSNP